MSETSNATQSIVRLKTSLQTYDWGKQGSESLVARLASAAVGSDFELDENTNYAEVSANVRALFLLLNPGRSGWEPIPMDHRHCTTHHTSTSNPSSTRTLPTISAITS